MTRLTVEPLTRLEGHGRVDLQLKHGRLHDVTVRLLESPRLFEKIVVGRRYDEVPELICRICAICSAVHKLTALQALENAMQMTVPPLAAAIRELLLLGGHIQSHALHLFCLILPDLRGAPDIIPLLRNHDPLAQAGLELKAFGNRLQEFAGGRVIHPINPVFGGVVYRPVPTAVEALAEELQCWLRDWQGLATAFMQAGSYPEAQPVHGRALATGGPERYALIGDSLWCEDSGSVPADGYAQFLCEQTRADSHAKDAAGEAGPFLTGALARARFAAERGLPADPFDPALGIHNNNIAQCREISWALQRVAQLLAILQDADGSEPLRVRLTKVCGGSGTAVAEAPRGLLIHHYVVDEWGTVVAADVVTPTAINQRVMAAQVMADLAGEEDPARLRSVTERIIRAYDPCISCAVHLLPVKN